MPQVLEGIRVVDLTSGPVGGVATMVLADFGADVVKVESPKGDRFRRLAASPMWLRGKRSVALDLGAADGLDRLHELIRGADVLVVAGPSGRAKRQGTDADAALALQPSLVHCSITPWGRASPYADQPGYEGLVSARTGRMNVFERQLRRGGPAYTAVGIASHAAAMGAVQGIAAGLFARTRSGRGQRVETSLLQALLPYDLTEMLMVQLAERRGEPLQSLAAAGGDMPTLNYHPVLARDGRWIQCGNLLEHLLLAFLDAIGLLGELLADERFREPPASWDSEATEVARDLILSRVREKDADEWMEIFRRSGNVAAEPYLTTREALSHPDLVGNGDVLSIDDPDLGSVRQIGPIARLGATPAAPGRPAPRVGEHTTQVEAEHRRVPTAQPLANGPAASGASGPAGRPLDGVTVLEIATIIAAPLATSMLADLGARVVRIESIEGDPFRHMLPGGATAVKTTAGKESICLDLKSAEGQGIAQGLARHADIVLHNFRPGVPERLGFGYEELRALNPQLVWVAVNGYGPDAPGANRPSTHPVPGAAMGGAGYQAAGAISRPCHSLEEIRETARQLMRANEPNPDPNTAVVIAAATLLALLGRERHGVGQPVYVNMLTANAYANADDFLDYDGKAERAAVDDELFGLGATYRLYPAQVGWIFLALTTDAEWRSFCTSADVAELRDDARFATCDARREHAAALAEGLTALFRTRDADAWESLAVAAGWGCVRADRASPGVFWATDAHVSESGLAPPCEHARFGSYRRWGPLVTVDGLMPAYGPGVLAGEHTDAILAELGRNAEEIARLRAAGVVSSEPVEW